MTDETTSFPPAGWYADANSPGNSKWWNGEAWTEHVIATPTPPPSELRSRSALRAPALEPIEDAFVARAAESVAPTIQQVVTVLPSKVKLKGSMYNPDQDLSANKNTLAKSGFIFGIFSVLINPFGIVGVGALVQSIAGLSRANRWARAGLEPIGRKKAVWGIALSSVGTIIELFLLGVL